MNVALIDSLTEFGKVLGVPALAVLILAALMYVLLRQHRQDLAAERSLMRLGLSALVRSVQGLRDDVRDLPCRNGRDAP